MSIKLIKPSLELLPSYLEALNEGRFITMALGFGDETSADIRRDPKMYISRLIECPPYSVTLDEKHYVVSEHELLWITDEKRFLGTVALRYRGASEILEDYAGHLGVAIRPSLLGKGFGLRTFQQAGNEILKRFKEHGLQTIYATCDPQNSASARLIEYFGGKLVEEKQDVHGTGPGRRYAITLG